MQEEQIKNLKDKVKYCLEKYPKTRESDVRLTNCVWFTFYKKDLIEIKGKLYVGLLALYDLPREDNIKRIRAKFNSKGLYLPEDPEVRRKRQIGEEEWRKFLGYDPELRTV